MRIGVPKEIKPFEHRVALTPAGVHELVHDGHEVAVQRAAGAGIGIDDAAYEAAGARIAPDAAAVFAAAELIVKVKEPQAAELPLLARGQLLFTYLHLAADPPQAAALKAGGVTAIAYETIVDAAGRLPLLAPMSEVAGRMSVQVGAWCLEKQHGGSGVLLGGVPGVPAARVLVLGGGVAGTNAARIAVGMGARVTVIDRSIDRLRELDERFGGALRTAYSTQDAIAELVHESDLVVGAVLIPGAAAPRLVTRPMLATMRRGSVLVDISIDQGGCFETSRPTTHAEPTYLVDGVVHYCVTNMPGAVPRTSTFALTNATLPYVRMLARHGWPDAAMHEPALRSGLNVHAGKITHVAVARSLAQRASNETPAS